MPSSKRQIADQDRVAMISAVRVAYTQADLTQADLADAADIAINTLSRRLNGWSDFTWPELVSIARATGMSTVDLTAAAERIAALRDASVTEHLQAAG